VKQKVKILAGERILEVGKILEMEEIHGDKCWGMPRNPSR